MGGHDAELRAVLRDKADFPVADFLVYLMSPFANAKTPPANLKKADAMPPALTSVVINPFACAAGEAVAATYFLCADILPVRAPDVKRNFRFAVINL
jgi:hypothetical protein